jgi:hypothetical protein
LQRFGYAIEAALKHAVVHQRGEAPCNIERVCGSSRKAHRLLCPTHHPALERPQASHPGDSGNVARLA